MMSQGIGRFHLYKNRGQGYVELIRNVITPSSVAGGFARYVGVDGQTAVLVALGIGLGLIVLQVTLGWLDVRYRVAEAHQAAENATDPWRRDMVRLLGEIAVNTNGHAEPVRR